MKTDKLNLANVVDKDTMRLLHYFAQNTTDRIFAHISRLRIHDTGALESSIRATVWNMAGGNSALVRFYFLSYAPYVEQAVGKYYGIDADLGPDTGVKSANISAPQIKSPSYTSMYGQMNGIPQRTATGRDRGEVHRPRPFLMSEIRYQLRSIQWRLLRELGYTASAHIIHDICDMFDPSGKSGEQFLQSIGWEQNS